MITGVYMTLLSNSIALNQMYNSSIREDSIMINRYIVTTEINTSWWEKFLRFFKLFPKLPTFQVVFCEDYYETGHILFVGERKVKVIKKYGK